MRRLWLFLLSLVAASAGWAWEVKLPARPTDAPGGVELARRLGSLALAERELAVIAEVKRGNVPTWWRHFADVALGPAVLHVAPDYLVIGSDDDFLRMPLSPTAAQAVAELLGCTLPTKKVVDEIFRVASVKLEPQPLAPGSEMTTVAQFARHHELIETARRAARVGGNESALLAGHKKDVVITPRLAVAAGRVAIYGWHQSSGVPIQPLFLGHSASWVDYSHGVRLVAREVGWMGGRRTFDEILADDRWWTLLSDEGPCTTSRYGVIRPRVPEFAGETWEARFFAGGVRALVGRPEDAVAGSAAQLVVYAVPAGNSIEQTLGRALRPEDDWHFDIQHVAAQVRWLRAHGQPNLVLAVVAPERGSWVTWVRDTPEAGARLQAMLDELRRLAPGAPLTLASHSAGGAMVFALMEAARAVPSDVERVVLLDANYRYDTTRGHAAWFTDWLRGGSGRTLYVAAYEDFRARLDGKPFVTAEGGTWGRSQAMLTDLRQLTGEFAVRIAGPLEDLRGVDGRAIFHLRRNPEAIVWHTRLVELNGLIHAMAVGTAAEGRDYGYLSPRVYGAYIAR